MAPNNSALSILRLARSGIALIALPLATFAALDTAKIDSLTGLKGTWNEAERVHKVSQPRNDLPISVDGWAMPPFMGLTSWAAFKPGMKDGSTMVMGDMVLLQDEVNPAMSAALEGGLSVTALHNHFFYDEPKVYFMHIGGEGEAAALARGVRKIQEVVKQTRSGAPRYGGHSPPSRCPGQ